MLKQTSLSYACSGRGLTDITTDINNTIAEADIATGLCHLFIQHTSASLIIGENCDPEVGYDLERFLQRLVPDGDSLFKHTAEGPDDMPAHIRSALTQTSLSIPIQNGQLALGTWQGVFLYEHRYGKHQRRMIVTLHSADE